MNVAILTVGTRGDVQPYVALGAGLKELGHEVTLVTGKGFEAMASGRGLRHLSLPVPALSPTRAFPVPVLPLPDLGGSLNKLSYGAFFGSITTPYRRMVNPWRQQPLGLPPLSPLASELEREGDPITKLYCCSPRVVPIPVDWGNSTKVTGYWFLDEGNDWRPPEELASFLEDGPPPVYIGFGSTAPNPEGSRATALAALKRLGLRGVLATGRRGMASPEAIEIEGAPHDWMFPRMAAVAHHGGAGTTAEGLRAGKPTAVFPSNFGDQLFWGRRVHVLGAGPQPVPQKKLTIERLITAIRTITENEEMHRRATELGEEIRTEYGIARAVEIIGGRTPENSFAR